MLRHGYVKGILWYRASELFAEFPKSDCLFIVVLTRVGTVFSSLVLGKAGLIQQGEADLHFGVELVETVWSNVTVAENLCCIHQQSNARWKLGGHQKAKMIYVSECRMRSSASIQHWPLRSLLRILVGYTGCYQGSLRTLSENRLLQK